MHDRAKLGSMRSCGLCGKIRDDSPHLCMADVVNLLNGAFADAPTPAEGAAKEPTMSYGLLGSVTGLLRSGPAQA